MVRYSVQSRNSIFVKGYGFVSFAKNMGKIDKNMTKSLSDKYSQKLLDHAKQSATDAFKTASKRAFQKIYNKIIRKQSQMSIIKKYLKKDIYLQNEEKEILMI